MTMFNLKWAVISKLLITSLACLTPELSYITVCKM